MKVIYLPLDERPCNLAYPQQLAAATDIQFVAPNKEMLGMKKKPAQFEGIKNWLMEEAKDAESLIISIDMLLYGGIVPSRLHSFTLSEVKERMNLLRTLKNSNKKLKIYAFNLIMRSPSYNSDDEEPDYYEEYGKRINTYGRFLDKQERQEITEEELASFMGLEKEIPQSVIEDFVNRRKINSEINHLSIDLTNEGIIDYLVIPLDDNAEYGFSPREQRLLTQKVAKLNILDQVAIYPGADEIGCTLFTKVFCEMKNYEPSIYVRYSSTKGPLIIPVHEDRSLGESIKSHITTAGGLLTEEPNNADAILMVHSPPVSQEKMAIPAQSLDKRHATYFSEINYYEFAKALKNYLNIGKVVGLADVALCNGGDTVLMNLLAKKDMIHSIHAYAAWNTSGNTMGTVVAHTIIEAYNKENGVEEFLSDSRSFYYSRLIEDWGYQSIVRHDVLQNHLEKYDGSYFDISKNLQQIENIIQEQLESFMEENLLINGKEKVVLDHVYSPWERMFEVGIEVSLL